MDTLGKFKTNFLKDKSSFKIGFNNRSPLSKLDGSIKSASSINIPKLSPTIGKDGQSILVPDNSYELAAQEAIGDAIGKAGVEIGKAIEKRKKRKEDEDLQERTTQEEYNPSKGVMEALNLTGKINK